MCRLRKTVPTKFWHQLVIFVFLKKKEEKKKLRKPARIFLKLPAVFVFALRLAFNTFFLVGYNQMFSAPSSPD